MFANPELFCEQISNFMSTIFRWQKQNMRNGHHKICLFVEINVIDSNNGPGAT